MKIDVTNYIDNLDNRDRNILRIDNKIVSDVDLFTLIISEIDKNTSINDIVNLINNMVLNLNKFLKKYFYEVKDLQDKYDNIAKGLIDYCWDKYLGLNLFKSYELEIDGFTIESYTKDTLFIHLKNNYPNEILDYLNVMIGNIKKMHKLNTDKHRTKIYIPLIFWFCKESPNYLPLISLRYSDVLLRLRVNKLENILFFQNIEEKFNSLKILRAERNINLTEISIDNKINKIVYDNERDIYDLEMENLTRNTIKFNYPELSEVDLNKIFQFSSNGIFISLLDFGKIRRELTDKSLLYKLFGKEVFFEYNVMYSILKYIKINLLVEFIYLDEVEREKFATSKLEYLIDTYKENIFSIGNQVLFNSELDFTNPTKFMYFYFKPNGINFGLHNYDIKKNNNYVIDYEGVLDFSLIINGINMFSTNPFNDIYYKNVTTYQSFINETPEGIHTKNFCLYPFKSQPVVLIFLY